MKKICFYVFISTLTILSGGAQTNFNSGDEQGLEIGKLDLKQDSVALYAALNGWWAESNKTLEKRMNWYSDAKFGCFIHWGVYSLSGGEWNGNTVRGYAEHVMRSQKIPLNEYKERLVKPFNPVGFDADEWMRHARDAGMRYFIVTAKHHDGFAMFFSDAYPYDMRMTQFKRDPMKELRDAAKKYGIKFGFYYSHAFDWEHPDAPGNDWDYDNPGGDKLLHGANWWLNYPQFLPHAEKYVNEKSIPQIQELIRNYNPDIMWFDTPHKLPLYENIRILQAIRELSPDAIVVNGRLARFSGGNLGDYANTGDRAAYMFPVKDKYWETIPTTNESYGYSKYDMSHKPTEHFIRLLASATAKGGNVLMNVGPMGDGKWDEKDVQIFRGIGQWLKVNGEAIYGNEKTGLPVQNWGVTTRKGNNIYLHIYKYPKDSKLIVGGLSADVAKAYMLAGKNSVTCEKTGDRDMTVQLPAACPDTVNTVIVLQLKKTDYKTDRYRLLASGETNVLLTFDAELSRGLSHGDGKTYRNFIQNWTRTDQTMTWNVRLRQPSTYSISLEYNKENSSDSGTVIVEIDGKPYRASYTGKPAGNSAKLYVADVSMSSGEHTIVLKGEKFEGRQYMRPMRLILDPSGNQSWNGRTADVLKPLVLAQADGWLDAKPETVTAQFCDRSAGGRHDFYSEGDYWWADPANPDAPYIQRDGETNPDNFVAHRHAMVRFSRIAGAMASAYMLTGDEKYARQVMIHAKAWFTDAATMMNPNLLYAQAIKGRVTGRGVGIIDTVHLMEVAQALLKIRNAACVDDDGWEAVRRWFADYLNWLMTHKYSEDEKNAQNNHATCWVMQVASFAKLTGDMQILEMCRNRYREILLPKQMADDGSFPREISRTKPYGYSIFNLDAMATICQILSDRDNDMWNFTDESGRNMLKGIEFMYPYTADRDKWHYGRDVLYWDEWPVAQPFLIFGAAAFNRQEWFDLWTELDHDPQVDEVLRNLPVRNPLIWME